MEVLTAVFSGTPDIGCAKKTMKNSGLQTGTKKVSGVPFANSQVQSVSVAKKQEGWHGRDS